MTTTKSDPVNHPKHYTSHPSGVEAITICEHFGFNVGNALKYLWRSEEKGRPIEDLEKAAWYIQREIEKRKLEGSSFVPGVGWMVSKEAAEKIKETLKTVKDYDPRQPVAPMIPLGGGDKEIVTSLGPKDVCTDGVPITIRARRSCLPEELYAVCPKCKASGWKAEIQIKNYNEYRCIDTACDISGHLTEQYSGHGYKILKSELKQLIAGKCDAVTAFI